MLNLLKKIGLGLILVLVLAEFGLAAQIPFGGSDAGLVEQITPTGLETDQTISGSIGAILLNGYYLLRNVMLAVGIAVLCFFGARLVMAGRYINDVAGEVKSQFTDVIIGMVAIIFIDLIVSTIFGTGGQGGTIWEGVFGGQAPTGNASGFVQTAWALTDFIMLIVSTLAVLMIVVSAVRILMSFGNESTLDSQKKSVGMAVAGLAVIALARTLIIGVIFGVGGVTETSEVGRLNDAYQLAYEIAGITNYVLMFVSFLAVTMIVYGAIRILLSATDDSGREKGKSIVFGAIVGLFIAVFAYTIIATVIAPGSGINISINL